MRVSLSDLPQVKRDVDFTVAGTPVVRPGVAATYQMKPSDLVERLPLEKVEVYELPPQVTFLDEGSFQPTRRREGVVGSHLIAHLIKINDDATRVIHGGLGGPSFIQPDGACWYQLQVETPRKPGLYHVELKTVVPDETEGGDFGTSELPFSIRVVEQAKAKRP